MVRCLRRSLQLYSKAKLLAAGANSLQLMMYIAPLELGGGGVEEVKEFKYSGSLIEARGRITGKVYC